MVEREPFGALEVERASGLRLQRVQHTRALTGELGGDARVDLHKERLGSGCSPRGREAALDSIANVSSERITPSPSQGARAAHDLAHALGHVLARHLDQPELVRAPR